jgi:DNA repair protein RecO (recombination protein O)
MKKSPRAKFGAPERRLGAVVLARANSGEADLVVTFLTRELGLITAIAKNARHSVRRFGGGLLDPARAAWYDFKINLNSDLALVARGENNPGFPLPPPEPVALALANLAVELVRSFEVPKNPAPLSFNLLVRHLSRLGRCQDFRPPALEARRLSLGFFKCYLEIAGFGATLSSCRDCGREPNGSEKWSLRLETGSALCPVCRDPGEFAVPGELVKSLGAIDDYKSAPPLGVPEMELAEKFFGQMAAVHSDRVSKSQGVLDKLLKTPASL